MEKTTVAILFGGRSPEYSVSLESASGVIRSLDRDRFTPVLIGISREGGWYRYTGPEEAIGEDRWRDEPGWCTPAVVSPDPAARALLVLRPDRVERIALDAAFPALHGRNGEDGTVQGVFALAGIPVVGCGVLASALCMDKDRAHRLAAAAGVRVPHSYTLRQGFDPAELEEHARRVGYPLFVKPVRAGSSYGISRVERKRALLSAVAEAFQYDDTVLIEEAIPGFEVGCAVMGSGADLTVGVPDEIELSQGFFDFTEKYGLITSQIHVPARITAEQVQRVQETAKRIYRALDCSGFARVDMFLTPGDTIVFNEVNTIPGFTPHSRFPSMMQAVGVSFREVLTRAIEQAVRA